MPVWRQGFGEQPLWTRLVYAGKTKIRQGSNPFYPQWKADFTDRAFLKKYGTHRQQAGIKSVVKGSSS